MLLAWLGERHGSAALTAAAGRVERAVGRVLAEGKVIPVDQGGSATTAAVGDALASAVESERG
jgi:3-isopropylmalate dehydrogenase